MSTVDIDIRTRRTFGATLAVTVKSDRVASQVIEAFARTYRANMRNWSLLWRRAQKSGNRELAAVALRLAVVNNRWARGAQ